MKTVKSYSNKTPKTVGIGLLVATCLIAFYTKTTHSAENDDPVAALSPSSQTESNNDDDSTSTEIDSDEIETNNTSSSSSEITQPAAATPSSSQQAPVEAVSGYKNGTYTKTVTYSVPHEKNTIKVTLTVKDGAITQVSNEHDYADRESTRYVDRFENAISTAVVGKKLDNISLSRVGGASLTTRGFMNALSAIVNDAKS